MSGPETGTLRADGATRGDRNEAIALVVAGACLLSLPLVVVADRFSHVWFWFAALVAVGSTFVLGLGLRWFLLEGPVLAAASVSDVSGLRPKAADASSIRLRLVEARNRLRAHAVRFVALGAGLVFLVVDVGPLGWLVVVLFGASFVTDHVLLRPKRYSISGEGLGGLGALTLSELAWANVERVYWRRYPGKARPPFPGGERVVIEVREGPDVEFVFSKRYGGSEARELIEGLASELEDRLVILQPRSTPRADVSTPDVSELVDGARQAERSEP